MCWVFFVAHGGWIILSGFARERITGGIPVKISDHLALLSS